MRWLLPLIMVACLFPIEVNACYHDCRVDAVGLVLIKQSEGFSPFIYRDTAGIRTIGFGHALLPNEVIKTPLMGPDALKLLEKDVAERMAVLNKIILVPLSTKQWDALTDLAYNIGLHNFEHSTLLQKVNVGQHGAVPAQFLKWDHIGKTVSYGLKLRRQVEARLYAEGTLE